MLKYVNNLFEKIWFPVTIRIVTLLAFIGLVIIGFSSPTDDPFFNTQLSKTNLTSVLVWRLWWPLIVLSAIFFGRAWCMICPMEMVTTFFAKIGFRLRRPRWILSGWIITVFYIIVLAIGITILEIDLNPGYTSIYLIIIAGIAVITGLLFEKNTFCRYVCPIGYMLGIFSKMAAWGWRVKKNPVCDGCRDKSCIDREYTYNLNYKSCGVDLIPSEINDNSNCLLCGGCHKTCKTYKSTKNSLRPNPAMINIGFANDLMQVKPIQFAEWIFLFVLTGSMIFEMTHFRLISDAGASFVSGNISDFLTSEGNLSKSIIKVIYLFFLLPSVLWFLPFLMIRISGTLVTLKNYVKSFSLVFLPVIAAFFVGLVIMEVATKFPYYKYIVKDVSGVETIKAILFMQIPVPQLPYWTDWAFIALLALSLAFGIVFSFRVIREIMRKFSIEKGGKILFILPFIFIILIFLGGMTLSFFSQGRYHPG